MTPTRARPAITPPALLQASATVVWRNLIRINRMPEMLLDVTVQSAMFVLLIPTSSAARSGAGLELPRLLPGFMVHTMVFYSAVVAMGSPTTCRRG
jgi:ABC-2 type transport system permease protein